MSLIILIQVSNPCPSLMLGDYKIQWLAYIVSCVWEEQNRIFMKMEAAIQTTWIESQKMWLFETPWIAAPQASLSITNSWSLLKPMSIELVMPSNHLILCHPILLLPPQSLPASESFPMSQLFAWRGQNTGVSVSVLPMNTQDWSPLGWTCWISLQSKGLSRVFSNTTVQKHQLFSTQLSSQSNSHIHTWLLEKP